MNKQIAFISEHASPLALLGGVDSGGQNVYVAETAKQLAQQGFRIDIFTRWEDPLTERIVEWMPGIRVIHLKAGPLSILPKEELLQHMSSFRDEMLAFILKENIRYSLIHAHFFMSALVAADLKKILSIPFIVTFHALGAIRKIFQGSHDAFPPERLHIERRVAMEADHIIAECPQDRTDLIRYYDADPNKIIIIPCGFSSAEFFPIDKAYARQMLHIKQGEKILLQLGRMVPRKGVDNVILALKFIKNCKCKLIVVGGEKESMSNDPELKRLKKLAESEGVLNRIIFAGRKNRKQLKYYYSSADVFITTPLYEPFGITPLEAMACGTPVIGSNVGGIKFSVEDGETGFLVPPKDPAALAEKIEFLLKNDELMTRMKNNALKRVNKIFTWTNVCKQLSDVYTSILHKSLNPKIQLSVVR
ncbi:MAG: glycosyltransferase family 1 protein [Chitinophagaceae bacterium]|nr:glycosyltransferase family 1 protein [Chitinophagaceae bacterium]